MDEPIPRFPGLDPEAYDYSDPDQDRRRQAEASLREDRLREVESAILSTPNGREWLWGLLAGLHVHELRIGMTGSEYENGIWMGEYAAGNRILRRFASVSPANFAKMFQEQDK